MSLPDPQYSYLFRSALAATTCGVILTDYLQPDNPIVYANEGFCKLTGYRLDEVLGRNCRFLQGADCEQPEKLAVRQAIAEGRDCQVTLRNYRRDGTLFWNDLVLAPIRNAAGLITHFVGVQNDVTDRIKLKLAAQKDDFVALLTHDLKSPVIGALRVLEHLADSGVGPLTKTQSEIVELLQQSNKRMLDRISSILEIYSFDSADRFRMIEPVDLKILILKAVEELSARAAQKNISLVVAAGDGLIVPRGEFDALTLMLLNLLDNAVKFSNPGGTVRVCAGRDEGFFVLKVIDNGIGISQEDQPHLLKRIWSGGRDKYVPTLGLGLVLSNKIAEAHGGTISCTSELGKGSTFTVRLTGSI